MAWLTCCGSSRRDPRCNNGELAMEMSDVKRNIIEEGELSPRKLEELNRAMDDVELEQTLMGVPLFSSLTSIEVCNLAKALKPISIKDGELIYRQGEPGETFFIIMSGEVERVVESASGSNKPSIVVGKPLGVGCCFGQMALVNEAEKRSCSMRSRGASKLRCIGRERFRKAVGDLKVMLNRSTSLHELRDNQLQARQNTNAPTSKGVLPANGLSAVGL